MLKSYIVGITGGSGSGKTTFVRKLKELLGEKATLISQDDYYLERDKQVVDAQGLHNFDLPNSIDTEKMIEDIKMLQQNKKVEIEEYVFNDPSQERKIKQLLPAKILLVEGLFVFHNEELKAMMDLKLFVHAHDVVKLSRRIRRDQKERNNDVDEILYRYENHVLPSYQHYIKPARDMADMVINNNASFDACLDVIANHLLAHAI